MADTDATGLVPWLISFGSTLLAGLGFRAASGATKEVVAVRDMTLANERRIGTLETAFSSTSVTLNETRDLARDTHQQLKSVAEKLAMMDRKYDEDRREDQRREDHER